MPPPKDPIKRAEWIKKISESRKGQMVGKENPFYGRTHTEESLAKMRESHGDQHGENNSFYGRTHTEESLAKMRRAHKGMVDGEKNPFYGRTHTEESIKKIKKSCEGKRNGKNNSFYGKSHTKESIKKMSDIKKGKYPSQQTLEKMMECHVGGFWYGNVKNDSTLQEKIRKMTKYKNWKQLILERDEYKDTNTKKLCIYPEVHHTISFNTLVKKYNIKTLDDARNCKELWDTSNGITLEKINHIKLHGFSYHTEEELSKMYENEDIE